MKVLNRWHFDLPRFVTKTKEMGRMRWKWGSWDYWYIKNEVSSIYLPWEKHETGANYIFETLQRFIINLALLNFLSHTLYIPMNNCNRENENRYIFAYIGFLSHRMCFSILKCFLYRSNTHMRIFIRGLANRLIVSEAQSLWLFQISTLYRSRNIEVKLGVYTWKL